MNQVIKIFFFLICSASILAQNPNVTTFDTIPSQIKTSVYNDDSTQKDSFYITLFGNHYRNAYGQEVIVKTARLDTLFGGLYPLEERYIGESKVLVLEDKNGFECIMNPIKKEAINLLKSDAFNENYQKEDIQGTFVEQFLNDVHTVSHPYTQLVIPTLSEVLKIPASKKYLFYIPKQESLAEFDKNHGDQLYFISYRDDHPDIIDTNKAIKNPSEINKEAYLKARLFDMILGDWNRDVNQWDWKSERNSAKYTPIPLDHNQAFSNYDGVFFQLISRMIPRMRKLQSYTNNIRDLKSQNSEAYPLDMILLSTVKKEDWITQARFIKQNLSDEIIDEAFDLVPKESQDKFFEKAKETLKYRRNSIEVIAENYYRIINKYIVLKTTDTDDIITINKDENGDTSIIAKNSNQELINAHFNTEETKEIWIYTLNGDDEILVKGTSIPVKIISGMGNDVYTIKDGRNIQIYDHKEPNSLAINTSKAKVTLTDESVNDYSFYKRKERINRMIPLIGFNPDEGFYLGVNNKLIFNNIRRSPFSHQHNIQATYYFKNQGYDLAYQGEYANILTKHNLVFETQFTSPNYATNFFGLGNNTENFDDNLDQVYNRVKLASFGARLGLTRTIKNHHLKAVSLFESVRVENTQDEIRFINEFPANSNFFNRNSFAGAEVIYTGEKLKLKSILLKAELTLGVKSNLDISENTISYAKPSIHFDYDILKNKRLTLENHTEAHLIFGDNYEFYQAATIGGNNGLRGFRNQRFSGKTSLYNSTDVRYNFRKLKSGIAPMNLGFYGGIDVGRVWQPEESSNTIHNSFGGGIWLNAIDIVKGQIGFFTSSDGARFSFNLSFGL